MEITGKIKLVNDVQAFDSGFTKREFVVTTNEQYPQDIKLELIKDRCNLIDAHKVGDQVQVAFNLRGNEYNGRYFVNLQAWKIDAMAENAGGEGQAAAAAPFPDAPPAAAGASEEDDLPF